MREASRDKATQLEEGGRKDNLDRRQLSFGTVRGVAIRSDCLDALDRALAHSLNDDHSQTVWLGDAVCISHRDTQRTFLPMRLRDIHASQWQGFIAFLLHLVYGHPLLLRVFPEDFIDARSVLALVLCHSSHSTSLAAKRMGQQVLQGLHLVPLPGLHCLNDTRLQPMHMLIDLFPWNGMPVRGDVGSSTSRRFRRHLHRPLDRFLKVSRSSTQQRSQPAFASGDVATRIPPTTGGHSLPLTPIPAPPSGSLTAFLPSLRKERYGLTTFHTVDQHG